MGIEVTPLSAPDKPNGKASPKGLLDPIGMTQPQWILTQQKLTLPRKETYAMMKNNSGLEMKGAALDVNRRDTLKEIALKNHDMT